MPVLLHGINGDVIGSCPTVPYHRTIGGVKRVDRIESGEVVFHALEIAVLMTVSSVVFSICDVHLATCRILMHYVFLDKSRPSQ